MDANELPTDVEALKAMVRKLVACNTQLTSANTQLCDTVSDQRDKLAAKDQQILELLKALRGKQRERVDPDQLLLFEIGELEKLIEEQLLPIMRCRLSAGFTRSSERPLMPMRVLVTPPVRNTRCRC